MTSAPASDKTDSQPGEPVAEPAEALGDSLAGDPNSTGAARRAPAAWASAAWTGALRRWLADSAEMILPRTCVLCNAPGQDLCDACAGRLVSTQAACDRCGMDLPNQMSECRCRGLRHVDRVTRLGEYRDLLRDAVLQHKNPRNFALARGMAELVTRYRGEKIAAWAPTVVTAVPVHWTQHLAQGGNHVTTLAQHLATALACPFYPRALRQRLRTAEKQHHLSRDERLKNLRQVFAARPLHVLGGARVLLVDDILTTGATASACAAQLRQAGASAVHVVVLARADGRA